MSIAVSGLAQVWDPLQQQPLAQGVGFVAMLIGLSSFLQRHDQRFRRQLSLYRVVIAVYFLLMSAQSAALNTILSFIRTIASSYPLYRMKRKPPVGSL